jgi:hypothetical protein
VKSLADRVASIENVIEAAKAPRVHDCPKCGAPLPASAGAVLACDYCGACVHLPLRT